MLAADYATLLEAIKDRVRCFFEANEAWLTPVLAHGRAKKELVFTGPPIESARFLVGSLEGAMLLARAHADPDRFRAAAARLIPSSGNSDVLAHRARRSATGRSRASAIGSRRRRNRLTADPRGGNKNTDFRSVMIPFKPCRRPR